MSNKNIFTKIPSNPNDRLWNILQAGNQQIKSVDPKNIPLFDTNQQDNQDNKSVNMLIANISTLNKNGYAIEKSKLDKKILDEIKKDLTVIPYIPGEENVPGYNIYNETDINIHIPRFYGVKKYGLPATVDLPEKPSNMIFKGELRDNQKLIVDKFIPGLKKDGGGMLCIQCGGGKTVIGLYIAAHIFRYKTLVLVHKTFLQDQWIERAKQFTNAKIGIIRQDKIADEDCDIVIGMIQSISLRDYDEKIFSRFGMLLIDECHHYASPVFSHSLYNCGAKYVVGLTATPYRNDKLTKVVNWHAGDILYRQKIKINKQVIAKIFKYKSSDSKFVPKSIWRGGRMQPSNVLMINNLVEIQTRNDHIVNIINELRKYPERKVLLLSGRREHLTVLKDAIDKSIKQDINDGKSVEGETVTSYYIGGMKKIDRKNAEENADILFGTYDMAHEGLDIDRLNTIILATPKKDIVQAVGRIMRRILKVGDLRPLIIDMYDVLSIFKTQGNLRIQQYNTNKYKIETFDLCDDKIITYKDKLREDYSMSDTQIMEYLESHKDELTEADFYDSNFTNILNLQKVMEEDHNAGKNAEVIEVDPNDQTPDTDDEADNNNIPVKAVDDNTIIRTADKNKIIKVPKKLTPPKPRNKQDKQDKQNSKKFFKPNFGTYMF